MTNTIAGHQVRGTGINDTINPSDYDDRSNAFYRYAVDTDTESSDRLTPIAFQQGLPPTEHRNGWLSTEVISMLVHHLNSMNQGDYRNRETSVAVTHLETALLWLNKRVSERVERGVYGIRMP